MHDDVYIHSRTKDHSNSLVNQCAIVMPRILSSLEIVGVVVGPEPSHSEWLAGGKQFLPLHLQQGVRLAGG